MPYNRIFPDDSKFGSGPNGEPVYEINQDETSRDIYWFVYDEAGKPIPPGSNAKKVYSQGCSYDPYLKLMYTGTYEYDEDGNLKGVFTYDQAGMLKYEHWYGALSHQLERIVQWEPDGSIQQEWAYIYAQDGEGRFTPRSVIWTTPDDNVYASSYEIDGTVSRKSRYMGFYRDDHFYSYIKGHLYDENGIRVDQWAGNPYLQPHGYNPYGAVYPDGSPVYGFGSDADMGTIWHTGFTGQGDPTYYWGFTGQGDPFNPIDPSNR